MKKVLFFGIFNPEYARTRILTEGFETLATGMPTVTTNIAFQDLLKNTPGLFITDSMPSTIAAALTATSTTYMDDITHSVRERFALSNTVAIICKIITTKSQ